MNKFRISNILILLVVIGVIGGIITVNNEEMNQSLTPIKMITKNSATEMKVDSYSVQVDGFKSLKALENKTSIIVKGIKKSEVDPLFYDAEGSQHRQPKGYTESEFIIQKVYKNKEANMQIKKNEMIAIQELEYSEDNQKYTINGYQKMKMGDVYLLYLDEQKGDFIPVETVYGKIPLSVEKLELYSEKQLNITNIEQAQSINELENELKPLFKEARKKYRD